MSGNVIVECRGITKRYGGHCALDHVDLDVLEGEVFGLVGPNGAGKTTFIKILLGLASPTAGSARMFGEDLFTERGRATAAVGAVVEAPVFFEYMSGWDNLWHLSALSGGVPPGQVRKALDIVGLADVARKRVGTYSYGMKQRLGIAQALLPCSRFLVLDEPTNGLDPHGIAGIRQLIRTLAAEHGITIFMSSHLLVEVEQLCGRVAILGRGKKVLEGTVAELRANTRQAIVLVRPSAGAEARLASHQPRHCCETAEGIEAVFELKNTDTPALVRRLVADSLDILEVRPRARTLEEVFIENTEAGTDDVCTDPVRAEKTADAAEELDGAG